MGSRAQQHEDQLSFGPLHAKRVATPTDGCKKVESVDLSETFRQVGHMIDAAREAAHLTRQEACALMVIDEPRYSRWVNGSPADSASLARLLLLPAEFWIELIPKINDRKGLRRLALARFLGLAADLAVALEK